MTKLEHAAMEYIFGRMKAWNFLAELLIGYALGSRVCHQEGGCFSWKKRLLTKVVVSTVA